MEVRMNRTTKRKIKCVECSTAQQMLGGRLGDKRDPWFSTVRIRKEFHEELVMSKPGIWNLFSRPGLSFFHVLCHSKGWLYSLCNISLTYTQLVTSNCVNGKDWSFSHNKIWILSFPVAKLCNIGQVTEWP